MSAFLAKMIGARGQHKSVFKCWKGNCHSEILYSIEIPFKIESIVKTFTDIQKAELVQGVGKLKGILLSWRVVIPSGSIWWLGRNKDHRNSYIELHIDGFNVLIEQQRLSN